MVPVASVCLSLHKQSSGDVVCVNFLLETDNLSLNFLMEFSKLLSCEWSVHGRVDLEPTRDRLPPLIVDPELVVDAFETELKSLSSKSDMEPPKPPVVHETAQRLVAKIKAMIPIPPAQLNSGYPLTDLASLFITIAADIPSRHIGYDLLVDIVREIGASPEPA